HVAPVAIDSSSSSPSSFNTSPQSPLTLPSLAHAFFFAHFTFNTMTLNCSRLLHPSHLRNKRKSLHLLHLRHVFTFKERVNMEKEKEKTIDTTEKIDDEATVNVDEDEEINENPTKR
ncbi:unnamed protein product, partial [Citrullus colocynthis]